MLRALAATVGLIACTTRSQVQIARPGPNLEVRAGTCAEQRAARADEPIVHCSEYSTLSPAGGVAVAIGGLAVAGLLMLAGIEEIGQGLGKADDH